MQLEQVIALGGQYHDRTESRKADLRAQIESDTVMSGFSKFWALGERPDWWTNEFQATISNANLTGGEAESWIIKQQLGYLQIDNNLYQAELGLMAPQLYEANRSFMKNLLRDPFIKAIYLNFGGRMSSTVREIIVELENE